MPQMLLMVNKVPVMLMNEVKQRIEKLYNCEVAVVVPHTDELMTLASSGIFSLRYPDHPVTSLYKKMAERVMA